MQVRKSRDHWISLQKNWTGIISITFTKKGKDNQTYKGKVIVFLGIIVEKMCVSKAYLSWFPGGCYTILFEY